MYIQTIYSKFTANNFNTNSNIKNWLHKNPKKSTWTSWTLYVKIISVRYLEVVVQKWFTHIQQWIINNIHNCLSDLVKLFLNNIMRHQLQKNYLKLQTIELFISGFVVWIAVKNGCVINLRKIVMFWGSDNSKVILSIKFKTFLESIARSYWGINTFCSLFFVKHCCILVHFSNFLIF